MTYYFKLILLLLIPISISAQEEPISITGTIVDENDSLIEYATIGLKQNNLATVSDNLGFFKLIINSNMIDDTLVVKHLGYLTKEIALTSEVVQKIGKLVLKATEYGLTEVRIKGLKGSSIIKKVIENMPNNYSESPYSFAAFFRQVHKENGKYVRLLEADVDIYDKGFYKDLRDEKYSLNKLRRSYVYEQNGEAHGDHLSDLIHKNPVKHPNGTIFSKNGMRYYEYTLEKSLNFDNRAYYHVTFETKDKAHSQMLEKGTVWVDKEDFSVLYYKIETINDRGSGSDGGSGNFDWEFIGEAYELKFKRRNNLLYPTLMKHTYTHNLKHKTFNSLDFEVIESFECYVHDYNDSIDLKNEDKDFKLSLDLYDMSYDYESEFWDTYLPLLNHPLNSSITSDLEKEYPLEYQFQFIH